MPNLRWAHFTKPCSHQLKHEAFEFGYRHNEESLLSRLTFSWIWPLLKRGQSSPLAMDDLKPAPADESAKGHSQRLSDVLQPEAIISSCLRLNWQLVAAAGISRLLADAFSLVGAISIKLVVQSMTSSNSTIGANSDDVEATDDEVSFTDARVVATVLLLSGIFQGVFSQTSTHLLTVAGTRTMTSLQISIYRKTLRLSVGQKSSALTSGDSPTTNEGNVDIGQILSLTNVDAANIRELLLNFHYVWALPLKVAAILCLVQVPMKLFFSYPSH